MSSARNATAPTRATSQDDSGVHVENTDQSKAPKKDWKPLSESNWESELNNVPLLMNKLPASAADIDDPSQSAAYEALQDLLYSGEPLEVATNFRHQGNDAVKDGRWNDALVFYSKGIETPGLVGDGEEGPAKDGKEGGEAGRNLLSVLHSNRAAVHDRLRRVEASINDTKKAIKYNPSNLKAIYRLSKSLEATGAYNDAIEWAKTGLEVEKQKSDETARTGLNSLLKRCARKMEDEERKRREQRELRTKLKPALKVNFCRVVRIDGGKEWRLTRMVFTPPAPWNQDRYVRALTVERSRRRDMRAGTRDHAIHQVRSKDRRHVLPRGFCIPPRVHVRSH